MTSNLITIIQWFAQISNRYVQYNLSPSYVNVNRLRSDPEYALKLFLFKWAYERNGAPRGYRIAAVKAVSSVWPDLSRMADEYAKFYDGPKNPKNNPAMDPKLAKLDIPTTIALAEKGNLAEAFHSIQLNGVRHKITAFFLRDVITLTQSESQVISLEKYLYCQPIDIWVGHIVDILGLPMPTSGASLMDRRYPFTQHYKLDKREDFGKAIRLIDASFQAGVSPLRVNQGIWYFCSNAVGDKGRLKALLNTNNANSLNHELALLDEVLLPVSTQEPINSNVHIALLGE